MPSLQSPARASTTFTAQVLSSCADFLVGAFALAAAGNNLAGFGRVAIRLSALAPARPQ